MRPRPDLAEPGSLLGTMIKAAAALVAIATLVLLDLLVLPRDPSQAYPLFLIVIVIAAWIGDARLGYATVAGSALALAYFNLDGAGFAVSNADDAIGLIDLIAAGLLCVGLIDRLQARLAVSERARAAADHRSAGQSALVSEISHRVMNDLGSLSALATLLASSAAEDETRRAMEGMADRMRFFAAVYRRLDVSGGAATDASLFLSGLCDELRRAKLGVTPVSIDFDGPSLLLPFSQAALIGLVLNEAVSNAAKYAFPDERPGTIRARLEREAQGGSVRLDVSDDGVGPDGGAAKGTGLGLRLIRSMAAQLHGTCELRRESGLTILSLRFVPQEPVPSPDAWISTAGPSAS